MEMTIDSELVRELRRKANWSQEDLAAASGLSLRTIQRVEKDGAAALETRKALAAAFHLRPENLDTSDLRNDPRVFRIGTGMLAVWIGFAWLFDLGLGVALLGVGAIYLAGQLKVFIAKLPLMWDLVAVGLLFLATGVASLLGLEVRLAAVVLVAIGCLLIFSGRKT